MIIQCAYCEAEGKDGFMGTKPPLYDRSVTHSICPAHLKKELAKIKERSECHEQD